MIALRRTVLVASVLAALALGVLRVDASSPRADAARRGAEWIASQQADDGGFFASGQRVDQTAETLAAMVTGGVTGHPANRAGAYIRKNGGAGATRGAYTGRIVAGLVAAGADPRSFGGIDYVTRLHEQYDEASGAYDTENLFTNLTGANGALAADHQLPAKAVSYIAANECGGGGFSFENHCTKGADTDTTAWAINLLVASGHKSDAVVGRAKSFILSGQHSDGGFAFTKDKPTSADSTGLVLTAIEALGEAATASPWRQNDGDDPVEALLPLQDDSGAFRFVASSGKGNALATTNAIPGLAKVSYPVPRFERPAPTPVPAATPRTNQQTGATATPAISPSVASASPLRSALFTAPPSSLAFGAPSPGPDDGTGIPGPLLWGGLAVVLAGAGVGTWLSLRRGRGA